jgi:hypothetical protein
VSILPLLGLDSFIACVALSAYRSSWYERCCLAAMFGLCDGIGALLCATPGAGLQIAPSLAIYCLFALLLGRSAPINRRWLIALPIGLGIDNLLGSAPAASAFAAGLGSMAWALLGLQAGAGVRLVFSPAFVHRLALWILRRVRPAGRSPAAFTNQ